MVPRDGIEIRSISLKLVDFSTEHFLVYPLMYPMHPALWTSVAQLAAVGPPAGGAHLALGWVLLLRLDLARCRCLLSVLQRKLKLVLRQLYACRPKR